MSVPTSVGNPIDKNFTQKVYNDKTKEDILKR